MPHIYDHIFEQFRIVDPDDNDNSIVEEFAGRTQWLEAPGCLFQRNNVVLGSRIRTEGVIKAGLFVSVILKGAGSGRWPVQREFNRRMKQRFQEAGIEIASTGQTILMQFPQPSEATAEARPRRAAG